MTSASPAISPRFPRWPLLVGIGAITALGATLSVVKPTAAVALVVLVALGVVIGNSSPARLVTPFVAITVVAAIMGPSLALPQAPSVFLFRILIVTLGLATLMHLLLGGRIVYSRALGIPLALLGSMMVWSVMSIAWAGDRGAAIRWTAFLLMEVGVSIAMPLVFTTRRRVVQLLITLGCVFVVVTGIAFLQVVGIHVPVSHGTTTTPLVAHAAVSVFGNQNNFATYLTLALPYMLCLAVVFSDIRRRVIGVVGTLAVLSALLFTGSRANLVAAALVFGALLVFLATDPRTRRTLVGAVVIIALAVAFVVPSILGSGLIRLPQQTVTKFDFGILKQEVATGSGSGAVRASLLDDGLDFIGQSGGLGLGAGNAESRVERLPNPPPVPNLHDWWLEVAVDLGVVGLALYVLFYLHLLTRQLRCARQTLDPLVRYLSLAGAISLVGLVVGSLDPSSMITFAPMWVIFGLGLIALVAADRARAQGGMFP